MLLAAAPRVPAEGDSLAPRGTLAREGLATAIPVAAGAAHAEASAPKRRSRAKPRPSRARGVVVTELRGLGGLVLEQALLEAGARPLRSLTDWTDRLSRELGQQPGAPAETYAELMHRIAAVSRAAAGDPRPTVALPRAA